MTRLLIIRHGETEWNREGRVLGRAPGNPLNDKGRREIADLADALSAQGIGAIYTSPMERAQESARILSQKLGLPDPIVEDAINEVDAGDWAGMTRDELADDPIWIQAHMNPVGVRLPNGEKLDEAAARAIACIAGLVKRHQDETFAIVTHGDIIRAIVGHYMGQPLSEVLRIIYETASVSLVELQNDTARAIRTGWKAADGKFPLDSPFGQ